MTFMNITITITLSLAAAAATRLLLRCGMLMLLRSPEGMQSHNIQLLAAAVLLATNSDDLPLEGMQPYRPPTAALGFRRVHFRTEGPISAVPGH